MAGSWVRECLAGTAPTLWTPVEKDYKIFLDPPYPPRIGSHQTLLFRGPHPLLGWSWSSLYRLSYAKSAPGASIVFQPQKLSAHYRRQVTLQPCFEKAMLEDIPLESLDSRCGAASSSAASSSSKAAAAASSSAAAVFCNYQPQVGGEYEGRERF